MGKGKLAIQKIAGFFVGEIMSAISTHAEVPLWTLTGAIPEGGTGGS